jgi:hypothetical protein
MIKAYNKKTDEKSAFFFVILIKNADPTSTPLVRGIFVSSTEPIIHSISITKKGVEEELKNDFSLFTPLGFGVYNKNRGVEIGVVVNDFISGLLWSQILISIVEKFQIVNKVVQFVDESGSSCRYIN